MRLAQLTRRFRDRIDALHATLHGPLQSGTVEGYRAWLCDIAGIVAPFEVRFAFAFGLELSFIQPRIKSRRLGDDLLALGLTSADYTRLARRLPVPDFHAIEALGWLAVVDGIVLSVGELRPGLHRQLPSALAIGGSFLRTYEGHAAQRWTELSHAISARVLDDVTMQRLITATSGALDAIEAHLAEAAVTPTVHVETVAG